MKILCILAFASILPFASLADDHPHEGPCRKDRETLCKDAGEPRDVMKCMRRNKDKLSAECREHVEKRKSEMKGRMKAARKACRDDAKKLCAGVERGGGRLVECLHENRDKLSPACQDAMKPRN